MDTLKKAEAELNGDSVLLTKRGINIDTMIIHARLAKVYMRAGQTNLSWQHIGEALGRASQDSRLQGLTNEATLIEFVDRLDKVATK